MINLFHHWRVLLHRIVAVDEAVRCFRRPNYCSLIGRASPVQLSESPLLATIREEKTFRSGVIER